MKVSAKRPTEATSAIDGFMRDKVVDFVSSGGSLISQAKKMGTAHPTVCGRIHLPTKKYILLYTNVLYYKARWEGTWPG